MDSKTAPGAPVAESSFAAGIVVSGMDFAVVQNNVFEAIPIPSHYLDAPLAKSPDLEKSVRFGRQNKP